MLDILDTAGQEVKASTVVSSAVVHVGLVTGVQCHERAVHAHRRGISARLFNHRQKQLRGNPQILSPNTESERQVRIGCI